MNIEGKRSWFRFLTSRITPFQSPSSERGHLAGCLARSSVAATLVAQVLVACLLVTLASIAIPVLAVGLHPNPGVDRKIFIALGCIILFFCGLGFYFGVARYWIGCVRWYHFDVHTLNYRTVFSSRVCQKLVDELELVSLRRPGSWGLVRFRDGVQLKLHVGTLQNASILYDRLKALTWGHEIARETRPVKIVGSDHVIWHKIERHLEDGEQVWWIGCPVFQKLWSEMAAEVIFGLIPGTLGLGAVGFAATTGPDRGFSAALMLIVVGVLFASVGFWFMAAPWRYRRTLQDTVYVVTSRRAFILGGFTWGTQLAVSKASESVQSFPPAKVFDYEMAGHGRDIILGGEWRIERRRPAWGHHGFLAVDDIQAAEAAVKCLISQSQKVG
jgi:hypothetical protein